MLKEATSVAPIRMGGGTCVFSPKLKTATPFDKMLSMMPEFGGDPLDNKRLRVALVTLAEISKAAASTTRQCCILIERPMSTSEASSVNMVFQALQLGSSKQNTLVAKGKVSLMISTDRVTYIALPRHSSRKQ